MLAYIIQDDDPDGGYFSMSPVKPDMRHYNRRSLREIRAVEIPDWLPDFVFEGGLPVDPDGTNDSTWVEYWDDPDAVTVWRNTNRGDE